MNVVEKKFTAILPPNPDVCQACATKHEPAEPHNLWSLYYKVKFHQDNGRYPTWADALAHCTPEMQEAWKVELRTKGVEI